MDEKHVNDRGMSILVTALFIVGETAGGGLIALPTAILSTGAVMGVFLLISMGVICTYTGILLAENWTILQELYPEYRDHCRKPYPAMGLRAIGPKFSHFVSIILQVTQFGTAVVFVLLAAKNGENILHANFQTHIGFCYMIFIVGLLVFPFTLPKSPKDFWFAVVAAMITTTLSVILIIVGAIGDFETCSKDVFYPTFDLTKTLMSFGTIMFSYGGHCAFPTIQHDMKKPHHFGKSVSIAFLIIFSFYLPVSLSGYFVYGSSLTDTIIPSLQNIAIQTTVNLLITLHVALALTIVFNPLNQEFEELLNLSHDFGWQRVFSRASMMLSVVFVAASIPNFGVLLDLVGGSTVTLMALVLPILFNFSLTTIRKKREEKKDEKNDKISMKDIFEASNKSKFALNIFILVIAIIGGIAATMSAIQTMLHSEFSAPCYANYLISKSSEIAQNPSLSNHGKIACCGQFRNISSVFGSDVCLGNLYRSTLSHG
ncbi:unnamed protein product [Caenorhabditis angaria]|uniref:Amino acid transporter transmembrane domain-containing protein n=1 Tax=Caenorhabditis angaria TaxID=860376 RepID=A0A9P1IMT0_9PELO|nr:unnamed protein product [Caenorhabditis angaria]